ncbi:unnamed protein product [Pylaiella littoralis]
MRKHQGEGGAGAGVGAYETDCIGSKGHSRCSEQDRRPHGNRRRHDAPAVGRGTSTCLGVFRKRDLVRYGSAALFLFAVLLALVDVMKNRRIRGELLWHKYYMRAVTSNEHNWHLGWRLEDLARRAASQRTRMMILLETLHKLPSDKGHGNGGNGGGGGGGVLSLLGAGVGGDEKGHDGPGNSGERKRDQAVVLLSKVLAEEEDLNRVVSVECAARRGMHVQVGMYPLGASAEGSCKVYSASTTLEPHTLFEKIELGEGRFALRAFSNRRFLRVVPPPPKDGYGGWDNPWVLEGGSPDVGLPEVFQTRGGMVYSEVMRGYLSCSGDGQQADVKGFVGEYLWNADVTYQFIFNKAREMVSEEAIERARILRGLSRAMNDEQQREASEYVAGQVRDEDRLKMRKAKGETIAVCVPMTSRGTQMMSTNDSLVWTHAFSTFLSSVDWRDPKFRFHWYLGFDVGDPIYDAPGAAELLSREFVATAEREFDDQGLADNEIENLVPNKGLRLKTKAYQGMQHAPSFVVSALIKDAYEDGCEYFYQINDDTLINTPGWAHVFTETLRTNPLGRNVGVTGPADTNNDRILTHAFVHRTHIDIFGRFFPTSFRNWWSDDWISNVYGREHTLRDHPMTITHDVKSQKTGAGNRYDIDGGAQKFLRSEIQMGHVKLSRWLKANGLPQFWLPVVCGYSPLASDILQVLQDETVLASPLDQ